MAQPECSSPRNWTFESSSLLQLVETNSDATCLLCPSRVSGTRETTKGSAEREVRIQFPPADSRSLSAFRLRPREKRGFSAIVAAVRGDSVGRDAQSPAISRQ